MASLLDTMATALSDESAVGGIAARLKARKPVVVRPAAIESASSSDADDEDDGRVSHGAEAPSEDAMQQPHVDGRAGSSGGIKAAGWIGGAPEAAERRLRAAHADDESRLVAIALDVGPLAGGHGLRRDSA